jgi:hypothetical protein
MIPTYVSDMGSRLPTNPNGCLKATTIWEFYQESTKSDGLVLNMLDLPLGAHNPEFPRHE